MNEMKEMNDNVKKELKAIREKYHIRKERLVELEIDEYDYQVLKESEKKNYIQGLLFDIVKMPGTDITAITENIINIAEIIDDKSKLQKTILGEISDCANLEKKSKGQIVHVSCAIANYLQDEP